jgi:dolichol-phosphate mannosyltransferase
MTGWPDLSIILPVHNEAESLPLLWPELTGTLERVGLSAEIIFIDDGSADNSAEVIRSLAAEDSRVRLIRFAGHAGLSAAFFAGYQAAQGAIVVTMDTDLQNDPADVAVLLPYLARFDAVIGWRRVRQDPWLKRISSAIANAVRNGLTGDRVADSASSFRVMRRECVSAIPPFQGMHRFVPTVLRMAGYQVTEVPVRHRPRRFGHSKFGIYNRARRSFEDLLVVRWMMQRRLRYTVIEDSGGKP